GASAPLDPVERLARGEFVDDLVELAQLAFERVLDLLDAIAADHAGDQVAVRVELRSLREEGLEVGLARNLIGEARGVVSRQPFDHLVELGPGSSLSLHLLNVHRVDLGELDRAQVHAGHGLTSFDAGGNALNRPEGLARQTGCRLLAGPGRAGAASIHRCVPSPRYIPHTGTTSPTSSPGGRCPDPASSRSTRSCSSITTARRSIRRTTGGCRSARIRTAGSRP